MVLSPAQAVRTGGGFALVGARGIAFVRGQCGLWAALLEVIAAPVTFGMSPVRNLPIAMVRGATTVLVFAAPCLLGVRPSLHPVRESGIAVVQVLVCMAHVTGNMRDQVHVAMPCARTSSALVLAAPTFLVL